MKLFLVQFRENAKTLEEKDACWQLENVASILGGVSQDSLLRTCESLETHFINRHTARGGVAEKPTLVDEQLKLSPTQEFMDGVNQLIDDVVPPAAPESNQASVGVPSSGETLLTVGQSLWDDHDDIEEVEQGEMMTQLYPVSIPVAKDSAGTVGTPCKQAASSSANAVGKKRVMSQADRERIDGNRAQALKKQWAKAQLAEKAASDKQFQAAKQRAVWFYCVGFGLDLRAFVKSCHAARSML